jgi:hypothetical protein
MEDAAERAAGQPQLAAPLLSLAVDLCRLQVSSGRPSSFLLAAAERAWAEENDAQDVLPCACMDARPRRPMHAGPNVGPFLFFFISLPLHVDYPLGRPIFSPVRPRVFSARVNRLNFENCCRNLC